MIVLWYMWKVEKRLTILYLNNLRVSRAHTKRMRGQGKIESLRKERLWEDALLFGKEAHLLGFSLLHRPLRFQFQSSKPLWTEEDERLTDEGSIINASYILSVVKYGSNSHQPDMSAVIYGRKPSEH